MKNKFILGIAAVGLFTFGSMVGCKPRGNKSSEVEFSFSIALESGYKRLRTGSSSRIVVYADGDNEGKTYSFESTDPAVLDVTGDVATGKADGVATIIGTESTTGTTSALTITVSSSVEASGGFNYASLTGAEALKTREEVLGHLEKYAMDNHLTGITLFENGGYVKYNERVHLPTSEYITGYGFGILSEGSLSSPLASDSTYPWYLHSATSSDPLTINEKNNTGSQVSDLAGYITSSFWGTKLNSTKDGYEWYPVLAKDTVVVDGQEFANSRPFPVYEGNVVKPTEDPNPLGLYDTWRIYVKTGDSDGIAYRTASSVRSAYNNRGVALEDYEFIYRFLLTAANGQVRGTEMAGDTTYGIKGASQFNQRTKDVPDATAKTLWNNMKADGTLGFSTGVDNGQEYIQISILNPIDRFTAMYTLSSSLVSPLPEQFIYDLGNEVSHEAGKEISTGAVLYGNFNSGSDMTKYCLCLGPYMLEDWDKTQQIIFKKNTDWFETGRYFIEGVKLVVIKAATSDPDAIYKEFNAGKLDSCGIPTKHISEEMGKPGVKQTKGDSTFKLNVNSCTQETWNKLFGPNGTINKNSNWEVKPWMSNDNFLSGLFYSINRKVFANNRGVQPSINYFSDAYLSDPENGKSYNSSEAHKQAVADYQTKDKDGNDTFGYDYDKAVLSFKAAVRELAAQGKIEKGTKENPTKIQIHIRWMYQTDIKEYGDEIGGYFESAFNNEAVSGGTVKLEVKQEAVTVWDQVYNEYLMKGQFDLGFGAISGNTYNPLNFLEVLKSDNSSGFTLNWGIDTSEVTEGKPVEYDHKLWSFDALWEAADHGSVVENGKRVKSVKECYVAGLPLNPSTGKATNNLYEGFKVNIPVEFINVPGVDLEVAKVQLYIVGSRNINLTFTKNGNVYTATVDATLAEEINEEIRVVNKLTDTDPKPVEHPFLFQNYGVYFTFEVYYNLSINGGTPSQSYVTVAKNRDAQTASLKGFSLLGGK